MGAADEKNILLHSLIFKLFNDAAVTVDVSIAEDLTQFWCAGMDTF